MAKVIELPKKIKDEIRTYIAKKQKTNKYINVDISKLILKA